jgi:hypothetical protein
MDKPKKVDPIEQVHFRVDEHERRFRELDGIKQQIPGMVEGGVAALRASMKSEFLEALQEVMKNQARDIQTDTQVIEELREVCACLRELCKVMAAPCTRESTINLPSGPVHMTVRERKN